MRDPLSRLGLQHRDGEYRFTLRRDNRHKLQSGLHTSDRHGTAGLCSHSQRLLISRPAQRVLTGDFS